MDKEEKIKLVIDFLKRKYGKNIKHRLSYDKFQLLIGTLLSQRTRDENTVLASRRLFSVAKTPEDILKIPEKELEKLIKPAGFYRQKAKKIKKICKILIDKYNSKVPHTREELLSLPGIGFKTADVVLTYGFGKPTIPVDVHVEVCSKRLGLVDKRAKYEEIRKNLEKLVPEKERFLINLGFVQFGKEICRTYRPKCKECELNKICVHFNRLSSKNIYKFPSKTIVFKKDTDYRIF